MTLETGTCDLCGQEMLRDTESGDVWHPFDVKRAGPPEPEITDFAGWRKFNAEGLRIGRPGAEHFAKAE